MNLSEIIAERERMASELRGKLCGVSLFMRGTSAPISMALPDLRKWVVSDAKPRRSSEQHGISCQAIHTALQAMKGMQNGGRMSARGILRALGDNDRNIYDYLKRLVDRGHLKRETLRNRYVYSLADKSEAVKRERERKALEARELRKQETAKRVALERAEATKQSKIAKLRREIKTRQRALQRIGA